MAARYYATRRLNPFRGVIQSIEVEDAQADSFDGLTWHLRADDGFGWVRPVGIWVEGEGLRAGVGARYPQLVEALERHPPLPFPLVDSVELWLLDGRTDQPLALLDSSVPSRYAAGHHEARWLPFVKSYTGYRSPVLAALGHSDPKETLTSLVNEAARPHARAQWFRRLADGSGEGLDATHPDRAFSGHHLEASTFPELLVREAGNNQLEQSAISDYHAWVSPLLLLLPALSDARRRRLERDARARPRWLLRAHRLLPKVLDPEGLNAALVAARLEALSEESEQDL